jgi:hypothetical protein
VRAGDVFAVEQSLPHGHVNAILTTMRWIGHDQMLAAKPCRERSLVMGLIAERLLHGTSKLAATRLWHTTTYISRACGWALCARSDQCRHRA